MKEVQVIGAGLAGCEASYQLAKRGFKVKLYEMKAFKKTPAQKSDNFAELVCSNSLKSKDITNACGLLKKELLLLDSLLIKCALKCEVPSGQALSVNRDDFAKLVTEEINQIKNIEIVSEEISNIDVLKPTILATGPLTSEPLCESLKVLFGNDFLNFYDACSPIIYFDSINMEKAFFADRYGNGDGDYLNCGMSGEEYEKFYFELINAKQATLKDFEINVFEGCMPVEVMAKRGKDSLRFGPLKPIGLNKPKTNEKYRAVVQLRKEDINGNAFNMVGFQTNLIPAEQKRVFALIPGLENAEYARFGAMHKNIFINAPLILNKYSQCKNIESLFIAGQLSGVEGYVESIASGLLCGINMAQYLEQKEMIDFTNKTIIGALITHISTSASSDNFQPMNANYAILNANDIVEKDKRIKRERIAENSLKIIEEIKERYNV